MTAISCLFKKLKDHDAVGFSIFPLFKYINYDLYFFAR